MPGATDPNRPVPHVHVARELSSLRILVVESGAYGLQRASGRLQRRAGDGGGREGREAANVRPTFKFTDAPPPPPSPPPFLLPVLPPPPLLQVLSSGCGRRSIDVDRAAGPPRHSRAAAASCLPVPLPEPPLQPPLPDPLRSGAGRCRPLRDPAHHSRRRQGCAIHPWRLGSRDLGLLRGGVGQGSYV